MKKILSLLLALTLVVSIAGCGKKTPTDPKEILKTTQENAKNAKSVEGKMTMDLDASMEVNGEKQDLKTTMTADITTFTDPMKSKVNMTMDLSALGAGTQEMASYIAKDGDDYYTYTSMAGQWSKVKLEKDAIEDAMKQANSESYVELYNKNAENFTRKGEVDLDGKKAIELEGKITGTAIKELIEESGVLDQKEFSTYKSMVTPFFEDLGDIPVKMYVESETMNTSKMTMDLKDVLQGVFDKAIEQYASILTGGADVEIKFTLNKCDISMTYSNYNKAADFEIPEEAKNAKEIDAAAMQDITSATDGATEE